MSGLTGFLTSRFECGCELLLSKRQPSWHSTHGKMSSEAPWGKAAKTQPTVSPAGKCFGLKGFLDKPDSGFITVHTS